jgi:hypothetical protein
MKGTMAEYSTKKDFVNPVVCLNISGPMLSGAADFIRLAPIFAEAKLRQRQRPDFVVRLSLETERIMLSCVASDISSKASSDESW